VKCYGASIIVDTPVDEPSTDLVVAIEEVASSTDIEEVEIYVEEEPIFHAFLSGEDILLEIEMLELNTASSIVIDDTSNPVSGASGEVFVSTAALTPGSFSHRIAEATNTTVSVDVADL